jgi:excinuclease ABC subunit C
MVVFIDGEADKSSYRRFTIKTVVGANDFASHQEMMKRRLSKLGTDEEERFAKPDLIVIDGGKGQLSAVKEIFDEFGVADIDLIALAERDEEIFTLYSDEPIIIPRNDYSLRLLQRLRDEAHRFAITHFRAVHQKRNLKSVLSEIEGIGKKKIVAIMKVFDTIDEVAKPPEEKLAQVDGIGPKLAKTIKDYFNSNNEKN